MNDVRDVCAQLPQALDVSKIFDLRLVGPVANDLNKGMILEKKLEMAWTNLGNLQIPLMKHLTAL